jgi:outer membrane lipoprotein-sorting protein
MKKGLFFVSLLVFSGIIVLGAQDILTAGRYLDQVSERYSTIRDWDARIVIQSGNSRMTGYAMSLGPNFLRIDFSSPAEQVITYNGESLMIYLPGEHAILNQPVTGQNTGANIATTRGLTLLRRNYIPAYVVGPNPVPIEEGSSEMVIKLRLARRSISEGFQEIILDINPSTKLIRRITGRTVSDTTVRFDFSSIRTNIGIPEDRFVFDAPPTTNMYNNFLFKDTE